MPKIATKPPPGLYVTAAVLAEVAAGQGEGLSTLARSVPASRGGGRARPSTLWRWAVGGVPGPAGAKIRLEAAFLAGRLVSSQAALVRFLAAQNPEPAAPAPATPGHESTHALPRPGRRKAELAAAEAEADRLGL